MEDKDSEELKLEMAGKSINNIFVSVMQPALVPAKFDEVNHLDSYKGHKVIYNMLFEMYNSKSPIGKRMATLLNASLTCGSPVTLMSRPIYEDLIKMDPNIKIKSCDNNIYTATLRLLYVNEFIEKKRESLGRHASVIEVISPDFLVMFDNYHGPMKSRQYREAVRDEVLNWWDATNGGRSQVKFKEGTYEYKMHQSITKRINESKKRKANV